MIEPTNLPTSHTGKASGISLVWIIPLVALIVGGWLVYKSINEKGPLITVEFKAAEGLEAGKTRVKYKEVEVGKVKRVQLNDDLSKVIVSLEMGRFMEDHLNENTRFWIVSPRISNSGVSGLSTLISGIHIAMDPDSGEQSPEHFIGLDQAPEIDSSTQGMRFTLHAETLGSLDTGAPVYYRKLEVGEVIQYELNENGQSVDVEIFINEPYDKLVRTNSRFWNTSGFNVNLSADGITAHLESLTSLISGGIAFDTPLGLEIGELAKENDTFSLHASLAVIDEQPYEIKKYYVLNFDTSLRGLSKGAPVEFSGIKVGEVLDISLIMDAESLQVKTPVLIGLHTDRIDTQGKVAEGTNVTEELVSHGLRAQLKSGNLLTGQLYVELEFVKDAPKQAIVYRDGSYAEFPTVPAAFDKITRNITDLLDKAGQIPLLEMTDDLRQTIKGLKQIVASNQSKQSMQDLARILGDVKSITQQLDKSMSPMTTKIGTSLVQLEKTLSTVDNAIGEDSALYYDLVQLIDEMSSAAKSFEILTDFLERHPNALLLGKPDN